MTLRTSALTLLLSAIAHVALADVIPTGPAYPAPGGNSAAVVGDAGDLAGADVMYSGFDVVTPGLTGLWQGLWDGSSALSTLDGSLHAMAFTSNSATTAQWDGTTSWTDPDTTTFHASIPTRLEISVTAGGLSWATLPILGLTFDPALGAVIDNSAGVDYTINVKFTADTGGGYVPINAIHQGGGGLTGSSLSLGFYTTVPEPSTLALAGFGLMAATGCGLARRRRRLA